MIRRPPKSTQSSSSAASDVYKRQMLLTRSTRLLKVGPQMSIGYIPRGPLTDWTNQPLVARVIADLEQTARARELVFLKIDPEVLIRTGSERTTDNPHEVQELLMARGWRCSPEQIQFKNTMLLHLDGEESDWLTRMKQKTRYNLRLAQKNGIVVRKATMKDLPLLYRMFAETARRDNFIIRSEAYYPVSYTHLRAHETVLDLVCRLLLEKKKKSR